MEIAFAKKKLRQLCESEAQAKRDLGIEVANILKKRIADLRAATCVGDLLAGQPREEGARGQNIAMELNNGSCMVFCVNHNVVPKVHSGRVDWSKVSRIKILRIECENTND